MSKFVKISLIPENYFSLVSALSSQAGKEIQKHPLYRTFSGLLLVMKSFDSVTGQLK